MKLWTMQPVEVYDLLMQDGVFRCDPTKVGEPSFIDRYGWIVEKLNKKDNEPENALYPIWAWYKFNSKERKHKSCTGFFK